MTPYETGLIIVDNRHVLRGHFAFNSKIAEYFLDFSQRQGRCCSKEFNKIRKKKQNTVSLESHQMGTGEYVPVCYIPVCFIPMQ
jgi:hypothetical protein